MATNPKKKDCEAELRKLGRLPSNAECKTLGKKYKADPSTVYRWAQGIHGKRTQADARTEKVPAQREPAKEDEPASAAVQSVTFEVDAADVAPEELPPPEASMPIGDEEGASSSTATAQRAPVVIPTAQIIGGVVGMMNVRFSKAGIEPVSDEETDVLVQAWDPVFQQYLPIWLEKHGPLIMAGVATTAILGPRFYQAYETRDQRKPQDAPPRDAPPQEAPQRVVEQPRAPEPPPRPAPVHSPPRPAQRAPEDELADKSAQSVAAAFGRAQA